MLKDKLFISYYQILFIYHTSTFTINTANVCTFTHITLFCTLHTKLQCDYYTNYHYYKNCPTHTFKLLSLLSDSNRFYWDTTPVCRQKHLGDYGAKYGSRTHCLGLGKPTLFLLSLFRMFVVYIVPLLTSDFNRITPVYLGLTAVQHIGIEPILIPAWKAGAPPFMRMLHGSGFYVVMTVH